MSLLDRILADLAAREIPAAVIGALALAAHGVVRASEDLDLLVGREPWMPALLERRIEIQLGPRRLPVVSRADLVLLKLFAGGPQDLLDVELLLAAHPGDLKVEVERLLKGRSALEKTWNGLLVRSSSGRPS